MSLSRRLIARRNFLVGALAVGFSAATFGLFSRKRKTQFMPGAAVKNQFPLDFQWATQDPFLFCVHHLDHYPKGNGKFGPAESLAGRNLGEDFTPKNGYRMYHGETVPGFPVHPHRGFETITVVRRGIVDHADSLGAAGRYGHGDVQWMTAGAGIQHSEMMPLLKENESNPLELFQIWINLPKQSKMVKPHFTMIWSDQIPKVKSPDGLTSIDLIAGAYNGITPPSPPPASWAIDPANEVAVWVISMKPGAEFTLPVGAAALNRTVYFYEGSTLGVAGVSVSPKTGVTLDASASVVLKSGEAESKILLIQGRPIGEPVVQYGPFVMNTEDEIRQTIRDYQQTHFGGWPWDREDMVHGSSRARFARYPDGREEEPA